MIRRIVFLVVSSVFYVTPALAGGMFKELSKTPVMTIIYIGIAITIAQLLAEVFNAGWFGKGAKMVAMLYVLKIIIDYAGSAIGGLYRL